MKVAINKCWGGFGISTAALKELIKLTAKCVDSHTAEQYYGNDTVKSYQRDLRDAIDIGDGFKASKMYCTVFHNNLIYSLKYGDEIRNDADLISVIEKFGEQANGNLSKVVIVEIPDGVDYEIDDYDGMESISEKHRSWG